MRLLATDPSDTFVLYGLAQEYSKAGKFREAVEWYDKCLAADPKYCYAYFHKARALEALEEIPTAIETLKAGQVASRAASDGKALSEISGYLDELE